MSSLSQSQFGAGIVIVRCRLKKESAYVEAIAIASVQPPNMLGPNRSGETSMLPGMVEMIVNVIPARVVSDPAIVLRVNVRCGRMPLRILISAPLLTLLGLRLLSGRRRSSGWSWAMLRTMPAANSLLMCHALPRLTAVRLTSRLFSPFLRGQCLRQTHDTYDQPHG
jgi:hypothetical protein